MLTSTTGRTVYHTREKFASYLSGYIYTYIHTSLCLLLSWQQNTQLMKRIIKVGSLVPCQDKVKAQNYDRLEIKGINVGVIPPLITAD